MIRPYTRFFLVGCGDCATLCKTGGEEQVRAFADSLEKDGKKVAGWTVLDEACDSRLAKKLFRQQAAAIAEAEVILVFACGSGVQTVAECTRLPVLPMLDSIFAGGTVNLSHFRELCALCGDCILDATAGICPVTRCPKGLVNGPCGGSDQGRCEEDPESECVWYTIYTAMAERGTLAKLRQTRTIKNFQTDARPRSVILKRR